MHVISAIIIGGIVGALAKVLLPGKDPGGVIVTILLGIAGGAVAGLIGGAIGWYRTGVTAPGVISSILGAMILLFAYRLVFGSNKTVSPR